MEEPSDHRKIPKSNRGKPFSSFLFNALLFASIIVVVPLFPSQAPEFIAESVITKFWELIHLLFIGIVVSYGLFCRRSAETVIETESGFDSLQYDMSRMFHVSSSRFDDGYENPYGFDEKIVIRGVSGETVVDEQWKMKPISLSTENAVENSNIHAWNSQYFQAESMVVVARPNCSFSEFGESRSEGDYKPLGLPVRSLKTRIRKRECLELVNGNESGSGSLGTYNSFYERGNGEFGDLGPQNFEGKFDDAITSPSPIPWSSRSGRMEMREKLNAISRPTHFRPLSVDETQFESLGMMRTPSLRSIMCFSSHSNSTSSSQGDYSPSRSIASEMDSKPEEEVKEMSSQESFASSGSLSPPKPRKSDARLTKSSRGSSSSSLGSPSPPKPMKPDARKPEEEVKGMSSQESFASSGSLSPPKLRKSDARLTKSNRGSSSSSLGSPSPPKPMKPDARKAKNYQGSSSSLGFPSSPNPMDDNASSSALHTRGSCFGSLYENDLMSPKDCLKEPSESRREDVSKESEPSPDNEEVKLRILRKSSSRGKSVRTIRSSRLTMKSTGHGGMKGNQVDYDDGIETEFSKRETTRNEEIDTLASGNTKLCFDLSKLNVLEDQVRERKEFSENASAKLEEQAENKAETPRLSLDSNDVDSKSVQGSRTPDSYEVDKKAGEFIAKFREQIRLQKMASMERSGGLQFGSNYLR